MILCFVPRDYYVITITTNENFHPRQDESWFQALVRRIAYQMVQTTDTDADYLFRCELRDLLGRLNEVNQRNKTVVLLIDELNKMGVPLDRETSSFLTDNFLDRKGRYLIFSSHVQLPVDFPAPTAAASFTSPSGRTMLTLPLPFCTDRDVLENMLGGSSVTDLQITLSVGIPSLLYVMMRPTRKEMTFQQRFDDVMRNSLGTFSRSEAEKKIVADNKHRLLSEFITTIVDGTRGEGIFEAFSTPVGARWRFPLPYIPIILQFLGENHATRLFESLKASAEAVETGRDWEMVITFSIYIRSLAAKYCQRDIEGEQLLGPFDIASQGVENVEVITIPQNRTTVDEAVQFIREATEKGKTIYIFQLAYSKFPDFDGFVSYRRKQKRRREELEAVTIHGYQCKLTRGYPRHPVDTHSIAQGWFLRGGRTINTPVHNGWAFPTVDQIETKLLGFGLRLLHPLVWGTVPESDSFDE